MATYVNTDNLGVVKKITKGSEVIYKTTTGDIVFRADLDISYSKPEQSVLRLTYKRERFNYKAAMPILPDGLDFRIRLLPESAEVTMVRLDVVDSHSNKIIVSSEPEILPVTRKEFEILASALADTMVIPQYNPMECISG